MWWGTTSKLILCLFLWLGHVLVVDSGDRLVRTDKVDRINKVEMVNKVERMNKVDTVNRVDTVNKVERTDKVDTVNKVERVDTVNKVERVNKVDTVNKVERVDRAVTISYSPGELLACIDDSDCAPLGRKFACFLYKCHNWVDSTPEHEHCHQDQECQKLVSMGEETGMVGTFVLDAKCYRHWNSYLVTKGVCFSSYSLSQCSSKGDCYPEDECCGGHCCPKPYFQQWQEFTCLFDQQCLFWNTGKYCCPNQRCCDTPREVVKQKNDFHDVIHHKESYHPVLYHQEEDGEKVTSEYNHVVETKVLENEIEVVYGDNVVQGIKDYHGITDYGDVETDSDQKEEEVDIYVYDSELDYSNLTIYNDTDDGNQTVNATEAIGDEYIYEDINTLENYQEKILDEPVIEGKQDIKDYEANEEILTKSTSTIEIIDDVKEGYNLEGIKDKEDMNTDLLSSIDSDIEYYDHGTTEVKNYLQSSVVDIAYYDYDNTSNENVTNTVNITSNDIANDITASNDLENYIVIEYEDYDNTSSINETDMVLTTEEIDESDILTAIEEAIHKEDGYYGSQGNGDIAPFEEDHVIENEYATKMDDRMTQDKDPSSKDAIEEIISELASDEVPLHETHEDSSTEILDKIDNSKDAEVSLIIKSVTPPDDISTSPDSSANSGGFCSILLLVFVMFPFSHIFCL